MLKISAVYFDKQKSGIPKNDTTRIVLSQPTNGALLAPFLIEDFAFVSKYLEIKRFALTTKNNSK
jgi:hypothetical protein